MDAAAQDGDGAAMDLPPSLLARIDSQLGVFTTAQALEAGLTGQEVGRLRASGRTVRLRRGVYVPATLWSQAGPREQHLLHARAVATRLETAFVTSHVTAAVAHDLPLHQVDLSDVHVTRPGQPGATRYEAGVRHHTGPVDEVVRLAGLPVTTLARTVADLARVVPLPGAVVAADAALHRGLALEALEAEAERSRHWPGAVRFTRALALADGRAESPGETLLRLVCGSVGFPPDELQWLVPTDRGEKRTDVAWTARRVVGEFDGRMKYGRLLEEDETASDVLVDERQRELAIERSGWAVVRFTWGEVHQPALVRARLREAFDRRLVRSVRAG